MLNLFTPHLKQLVTFAEQNADPAEVSALILDTLPEDDTLDSALYNLLQSATSFKRLKLLVPEIGMHEAWFERLRVEMLKAYEEPDAEPAPSVSA